MNYDDIATSVCQTVADMDDRNSPEDQPEMMLVTGRELHAIVKAALVASAQPVAAEPDGTLHADGYFTWAKGKRPAYLLDQGLPCKFYLAAQTQGGA